MRILLVTNLGTLEVKQVEGAFWMEHWELLREAKLSSIRPGMWLWFSLTPKAHSSIQVRSSAVTLPIGRGAVLFGPGHVIITTGVLEDVLPDELAGCFLVGRVDGPSLYTCLVDQLAAIPVRDDDGCSPLYPAVIQNVRLVDSPTLAPITAKQAAVAKRDMASRDVRDRLRTKLQAQITRVQRQLRPDAACEEATITTPEIELNPRSKDGKDLEEDEITRRLRRFQDKLGRHLKGSSSESGAQAKVVSECNLHGLRDCQTCQLYMPAIDGGPDDGDQGWLHHQLIDESNHNA